MHSLYSLKKNYMRWGFVPRPHCENLQPHMYMAEIDIKLLENLVLLGLL